MIITVIKIETKQVLKDPSAAKLDIKHKVDKILANLWNLLIIPTEKYFGYHVF